MNIFNEAVPYKAHIDNAKKEVPISNKTEAITKEVKQTVTQTEKEPITEKSSLVPDTVSAKIQIYEGTYFNARCFGDNDRSDYSPVTCEIVISNVTDTSFDFTVLEVNSETKANNVIFLTHTAKFIGNGMVADFYGNE